MGRKRIDSANQGDRSPADDPRFVAALARGIEVMRSFRPQDRWLAHGELVRRTGLPRATVSRLTFTLARLGYLRHRPATGEYALGAAVLGLGFSMLSNFDIGRIARPYMQEMADACESAVSLGARHQLTMVYVAHCRSTARLILGLDVGTRLPLASTAMGRAVLCASSAREREGLFKQLEADDPVAWADLQPRLQRAQSQFAECGFVTSESEWEADIAAAGAPLEVGDGRPPLALTVGGPAARLQGRFLHEKLGPLLVRTAADISAAIHAADWID